MQVIVREPGGYTFCGERIGADIGEALDFLRWLGADPGEVVEVRQNDRVLIRGTLKDVAKLAS